MNKLKKEKKIILIVLILFTLFRIFLAVKTPLFLQADAGYDDYLFIKYTKELLKFNWLGNFSLIVLAKSCSFSFFLAFIYLLGIPYSFALIILYIFSIFLFLKSISNWIKNKYVLGIIYLFMLYSPIMFHSENSIKVYRGGLIICFSLLVISSFISIYAKVNDNKKVLIKYSIITSLFLSFFWFLKEDSIWIMPFVIGSIILSFIKIKNKKDYKRIIILIFPLIFLIISILLYKSINYFKYGEFTITDRNGTYFKEVISDLICIEDKDLSYDIWVSKKMFKEAYKVSPTLKKIEKNMDKKFDNYGKEIEGDIVFWLLKEAVNDSGVYSKGGKYTNNFYKKIDKELKMGFKNGKLRKNSDIRFSSIAKGISKDEFNIFIDWMNKSKNNIINYESNEVNIFKSTGDINELNSFNEITMSQFILPNVDENTYSHYNFYTYISNKIIEIYKISGKYLFGIFIIEYLIFTIKIIYGIIKKKMNAYELDLYLIITGIIVTSFTLFFGVTYFSRFLSQRKVYDYLSPIIPLIEFLEILSLYLLFIDLKKIRKLFNK